MPDTTTPPPAQTINITEAIKAAYLRYLDAVVDTDFAGTPIKRGDTYPYRDNQFAGLVDFAAGASPPAPGLAPVMVALDVALNALDEIALAGMSYGEPGVEQEVIDRFHAGRAWAFIGMAARAKEQARALLSQHPAVAPSASPAQGDEALMRLALEELVDCPSRVGGYGKRSKVIAALRARLEGTK
jgi:hypothetical protein